MIAWKNCAARECVGWEYWLPVMLDGFAYLAPSVSGSAGSWRVWRIGMPVGGGTFYSSKAAAFADAELLGRADDR